MTARAPEFAPKGPKKFGGLTIGAWRDHFARCGDEGGGHMTAKDCRDIAKLLRDMSAERCEDAVNLVTLTTECDRLTRELEAEATSGAFAATQRDELAAEVAWRRDRDGCTCPNMTAMSCPYCELAAECERLREALRRASRDLRDNNLAESADDADAALKVT